MSIAVAGVAHPTLVAFLTTGCTTCADFWSAFSDSRTLKVPGGARLVVVTKGDDGESRARLRKFVPDDVPVVMSSDAWTHYDVPVAPYFVFVEAETGRVVGEGAAMSWPQLSGMMEQALEDAGYTRSSARSRRRPAGDGNRLHEERMERALLSAGIEPGDPRLYPESGAELLDPDHEQRDHEQRQPHDHDHVHDDESG